MEIHQIRCFLAVAERLHFRRAAEAMHLSQPALSLQIQALEEEIGVLLLKRNRQTTMLTHAGEIFREEIGNMLARGDLAAERVRRAAMGSLGFLRIGFISTAATARVLPPLISEFRETYPHIELTLQNLVNVEQVAMIENRELDIGFLRMPIALQNRIEWFRIHKEPHVLLLPAAAALAQQKTIGPRDVHHQQFVMYSRKNAPGYHDFIMRALNDKDINPNIAQEVGEMYTLVSLVSAGIGIAIAPISAQSYNLPGVVAREVPWLPPAEIAIGFHRDNDQPSCRLFIDMARRVHDAGLG